MPIESKIDAQNGIVFTRAYGVVDNAQIFEHEQQLPSIQGFEPGLDQLVDAADVSENEVTTDGVRMLGSMSPFLPTVKRAYVVDDEFAKIIATIFGAHSSEHDAFVHVTRDLEDACHWLDVDLDEAKAHLADLEANS